MHVELVICLASVLSHFSPVLCIVGCVHAESLICLAYSGKSAEQVLSQCVRSMCAF